MCSSVHALIVSPRQQCTACVGHAMQCYTVQLATVHHRVWRARIGGRHWHVHVMNEGHVCRVEAAEITRAFGHHLMLEILGQCPRRVCIHIQ
jgi:hypothetical protein